MANYERITTGKSMYGGYYARDSKGNLGRGGTKGTAIQALKSAQNQPKK